MAGTTVAPCQKYSNANVLGHCEGMPQHSQTEGLVERERIFDPDWHRKSPCYRWTHMLRTRVFAVPRPTFDILRYYEVLHVAEDIPFRASE